MLSYSLGHVRQAKRGNVEGLYIDMDDTEVPESLNNTFDYLYRILFNVFIQTKM